MRIAEVQARLRDGRLQAKGGDPNVELFPFFALVNAPMFKEVIDCDAFLPAQTYHVLMEVLRDNTSPEKFRIIDLILDRLEQFPPKQGPSYRRCVAAAFRFLRSEEPTWTQRCRLFDVLDNDHYRRKLFRRVLFQRWDLYQDASQPQFDQRTSLALEFMLHRGLVLSPKEMGDLLAELKDMKALERHLSQLAPAEVAAVTPHIQARLQAVVPVTPLRRLALLAHYGIHVDSSRLIVALKRSQANEPLSLPLIQSLLGSGLKFDNVVFVYLARQFCRPWHVPLLEYIMSNDLCSTPAFLLALIRCRAIEVKQLASFFDRHKEKIFGGARAVLLTTSYRSGSRRPHRPTKRLFQDRRGLLQEFGYSLGVKHKEVALLLFDIDKPAL